MDSKFPTRLRHARTSRDMTLEELAAEIDVSYQAIQQWETGNAVPRIQRIGTISRALRVSERWLLYGDEPYKPGDGFVAEPDTEPLPPTPPGPDLSFAARLLIELIQGDPDALALVPDPILEDCYLRLRKAISGR
jgi:transcriptional regulator with XRE-family HTH domain